MAECCKATCQSEKGKDCMSHKRTTHLTFLFRLCLKGSRNCNYSDYNHSLKLHFFQSVSWKTQVYFRLFNKLQSLITREQTFDRNAFTMYHSKQRKNLHISSFNSLLFLCQYATKLNDIWRTWNFISAV